MFTTKTSNNNIGMMLFEALSNKRATMAMAALWQPHQTGQELLEHVVARRFFGAGFGIGGGLFVLTFASTLNFGNSFRGV